jgi:hypothetical protein
MSSRLEPEPPWKTKKTGLSDLVPAFSLMYFCELCRIDGVSCRGGREKRHGRGWAIPHARVAGRGRAERGTR